MDEKESAKTLTLFDEDINLQNNGITTGSKEGFFIEKINPDVIFPGEGTEKNHQKTHENEFFQQEVQLIDHFFLAPQDNSFSFLMTFFDSVPFYTRGKPRREQQKYLPSIERTFMFSRVTFTVCIKPIRLEIEENGVQIEKEFYPGMREELVSDALRKIACEGRGAYLIPAENDGDSLYMDFSMYELLSCLAAAGHSYSHNELKQALTIMRFAPITISATIPRQNPGKKSSDKHLEDVADLVLEGERFTTIIEDLSFVSRKSWSDHGKRARCRIRFNPYVSRSILNKGYRLFNWNISMRFKKPLSRWLYKRLAMRFTYASTFGTDFSMLMSTIIEESGCQRAAASRNCKRIREACKELKAMSVIRDFEENYIFDPKRQNRIADARYTFFPSRNFASEMVMYNTRFRDLQEGE